jgi:hypothetical protein
LKAKFAASNPSANVARIADIAFALERHRARALLDAAAD